MGLYRRDARRRLGVAALVATALAVRLAAVVVFAPPADRPVTYEHGAIADNLLAGRGFSVWFLGSEGPTSQQAPWVPLLLAACSLPFGHVMPTAVVVFQVLQCFTGATLCFCVAKAAWRMFPERRGIGWATAWAAALYPPYVYMATHVQAAPWAALGLAMLWMLIACPHRAATPRTAVLSGMTLGWLLLIDPICGLAAPIVAWRIFAATSSASGVASSFFARFKPVALTAATAAVLIAPWLVRNVVVHGEFVFIKSSFGYAFWQGNNALSLGTDKIPKPSVAAAAAAHDGSLASQNQALWEARHETLYIDDVLLKPDGYREFAGLSEPERSRLLGRRAWAYVTAEPGAYAERCLRRLRYFLLWDETNPKAMNPVYRLSSALWLTVAGVGLLAARRQWRTLAPTMILFAAVMLFHVLTITSARFRLPVEFFGLFWGAVGLEPAAANVVRRVLRLGRAEEEAPAVAATMPVGKSPTTESGDAPVGRAKLAGPHTRTADVAGRVSARRR